MDAFGRRCAAPEDADMTPDQDGPSGPPEDLSAFGQKLANARKQEESRRLWRKDTNRPPQSALGLAFRVAVELVSAVAVGLAIGWGIDAWLDTKPWAMVVFIVLGGAAGVMNVYRMAAGMSGGIGYTRENQTPEATSADTAREEGKDGG